MSYLFPITIDRELLTEYRDDLECAHQDVERLAIGLEQTPQDLDSLEQLRTLTDHLWSSSVKLDLVPLSESLDDILKGLDLLVRWEIYPTRFSEFILLLMDRLVMLARDAERNLVIDIRKTQHILVALQKITLTKNPQEFTAGLETAITAITREIYENLGELEDTSDLLLFDEGVDLFDEEVSAPSFTESTKVKPLVSEGTLNPLAQAREYIETHCEHHPVMLLATISDLATLHGESHTQFLLELSLAVNILAGEPIDVEGLFKGVCLHDIALASLPNIITKKGKLTHEELRAIKQHPIEGARLAREFDKSEVAELVVLHHHERMNGKGYPSGLKGEQISEAGKLVAIIDSFHAMVGQRPHKKYTKSVLRAVAEINACVDTEYDKHWIKPFNRLIRDHWLPEQKKA